MKIEQWLEHVATTIVSEWKHINQEKSSLIIEHLNRILSGNKTDRELGNYSDREKAINLLGESLWESNTPAEFLLKLARKTETDQNLYCKQILQHLIREKPTHYEAMVNQWIAELSQNSTFKNYVEKSVVVHLSHAFFSQEISLLNYMQSRLIQNKTPDAVAKVIAILHAVEENDTSKLQAACAQRRIEDKSSSNTARIFNEVSNAVSLTEGRAPRARSSSDDNL